MGPYRCTAEPYVTFEHDGLLAAAAADLLGPTYPSPTDLTSPDSKVQKAWTDLSKAFDETLKQNNTPAGFKDLADAGKVTWSASLFSLHDPDATQLQHHYTAPQVANAVNGTNQADGDSIYRVASVSKLNTVFAGMIALTNAQWNMPLSKIFPALVTSSNGTNNPILSVQWDSITPLALASQLSGIATLGLPQGDLIATYSILAAATNKSAATLETQDGFPPLPLTILGPCQDLLFDCSRAEFIESFASDPPAQLPWATPGYSDLGFMVLGAAISRLTGKSLDDMYQDLIFTPLGMSSTYVNAPVSGPAFNDHGIVVGPFEGSWSFAENNPTIPSGGILSSINDLNKLGFALLNSTLLDEVRTREWMKPRTHTASLTESAGSPWEIVRYLSPSTGKVTDIYTKLGDSGAYGSMVALVPDYGAGWTMLNAYYDNPPTLYRGDVALAVINHIAEAIIPALEAQAAAEATKNFVGTYTSEDSNLNSSLVIGFNNSDVPTSFSGLSIDAWISNDTDMLNVDNVGIAGLRPYLQPTITNGAEGEASQVAFRASVNPQYSSYLAAKMGPFTGFYASNWDVWTYDGSRYGDQQVRSLIFNVDSDRCARSVYLPALRVTLKRTETQGKYIMRGMRGS